MLENVWIIPLLPALSFVVTLLFGKRMGEEGKYAHIPGIATVGAAMVLALVTAGAWIGHVDDAEGGGHGDEAPVEQEHGLGDGEVALPSAEDDAGEGHGAPADEAVHHGPDVDPVLTGSTWFENQGHEFQVGTMVDGLSAMMLVVVTIVSLLVHIYSTDYVGGDRRYTHFFAFLNLFTASMLLLVIARSTIQLLVAWELVGLCSFALIGHWWEEKENSDAALKAFITNRVGDVGLIVGVITLFFAAGGTFDIVAINTLANEGAISHTLLLVSSVSLLAAVMSKSGQFILHTWLPDAMAGPTPVSALIHAATMVVAGIFMVARLYGVFFNGFLIGESNINLLAVVGAVTVVGGAALAFVQSDIKRVLAYSTVSQLGYMVMALGVGAWSAALFHLFTHAFFKAGLFLGAGSVSHAVHSFDMKEDMGGLKEWMPRTHAAFVVCSLALAGIFPLSGFFSKDEILAGASQLGNNGDGYPVMFVMGCVGAVMTAAYMTRAIWYTFHGEFRGHGTPHESGPRILVPIWILTGLAVVAGLANFPWGGDSVELRFEHYVQPVGAYFPAIAVPHFSTGTALISTALAVGGGAMAYAWYFRGLGFQGITERNRVARAGLTFLEQKYYLDHLYTNIIVGGVKGPIARAAYWFNQRGIDGVVNGAGTGATRAGQWVYKYIDQGVVDNVVNGAGAASEGGGEALRSIQSGKVQQYAALLFAAAAVLAGVFVIVL